MANSQLIEILALAMIAGVILFRLYTVLGRRTGHEPPEQPYRLPAGAEQPADKVIAPPAQHSADVSSDPLARGLADIKNADRGFDPAHFVSGAEQAYEMILTAFAANDRVTLKPLLSDEVYGAFDSVMRARDEKAEKASFTFVGFKDSKIVHAELKGRNADVTVSFAAQYISATMDASGAVVDGDPKSVREVTDVWSFERNVRASDPNWMLVATAGGELHN